MMEQHGSLDPDIGYWADGRGPDGHAAPALLHVPRRRQVGERHDPADALRRVPAVRRRRRPRRAAAPDARRGAVRARGPRAWRAASARRSGWTAFWVIGLASPVAIYALDFWEHTLGLGLMLWGVVLVRAGRARAAIARVTGCIGGRAVRRRRDDAHRGARLPRGVRRHRLPRDAGARPRPPGDHRARSGRARRRRSGPGRQRRPRTARARHDRSAARAPPAPPQAAGTSLGRSGARSVDHVLGTNRLAWASDLVLGGAIVAAAS